MKHDFVDGKISVWKTKFLKILKECKSLQLLISCTDLKKPLECNKFISHYYSSFMSKRVKFSKYPYEQENLNKHDISGYHFLLKLFYIAYYFLF